MSLLLFRVRDHQQCLSNNRREPNIHLNYNDILKGADSWSEFSRENDPNPCSFRRWSLLSRRSNGPFVFRVFFVANRPHTRSRGYVFRLSVVCFPLLRVRLPACMPACLPPPPPFITQNIPDVCTYRLLTSGLNVFSFLFAHLRCRGSVDHEKVFKGLTSLRAAGIRPKWLVLDDGWQSTSNTDAANGNLSLPVAVFCASVMAGFIYSAANREA